MDQWPYLTNPSSEMMDFHITSAFYDEFPQELMEKVIISQYSTCRCDRALFSNLRVHKRLFCIAVFRNMPTFLST